MADHDAWKREGIDCWLKRGIDRHTHSRQDYRFCGSCAFGRQQTRNTRLNNSSCNQRLAWRCGDTIPSAR